jgi:hypothetical protein
MARTDGHVELPARPHVDRDVELQRRRHFSACSTAPDAEPASAPRRTARLSAARAGQIAGNCRPASSIMRNASARLAASATAAGVGCSFGPERVKRRLPSSASRLRMRRLTAAGVTPSSLAARVKLE